MMRGIPTDTPLQVWLKKNNACRLARLWVHNNGYTTLRECWVNCKNKSWMTWLWDKSKKPASAEEIRYVLAYLAIREYNRIVKTLKRRICLEDADNQIRGFGMTNVQLVELYEWLCEVRVNAESGNYPAKYMPLVIHHRNINYFIRRLADLSTHSEAAGSPRLHPWITGSLCAELKTSDQVRAFLPMPPIRIRGVRNA